jgi:FixJ family two-component response regulator
METTASNDRVVAVVDDDEPVRAALRSLLRSLGFDVEVFASAEDFLGGGGVGRADCLIVDLRMSGMSGLELQRDLAAAGTRLPTIFISAHEDLEAQRQAFRQGALAYLCKPFAESSLIEAVHTAFAERTSYRQ